MIKANEIYVAYGDHPFEMTQKLLEAAQLIQMISPGAKVGIKPNLVVSEPAQYGATTHPEIVAATVHYLQQNGVSDITILEGSWVGDRTSRAFSVCGYTKLSQRYGVALFDTKHDVFVRKTYKEISMEISQKALEMDFLIDIPVLKGHCQTKVTGALKNLKGLISDAEKRHFHTLGLTRPIAYLSKLLPVSFVITDGICGDLDFEEGGNPVPMHRIFCALDPVLADSFSAQTMGYFPDEIEHIALAAQLGVGSMDLSQASITTFGKDTSPVSPPKTRKVQRLARYIHPKDACSACYANLIHALARLDSQRDLSLFSRFPICIGQGYQKETGSFGVGRCTCKMQHSVSGCPPTAQDILLHLQEYLDTVHLADR